MDCTCFDDKTDIEPNQTRKKIMTKVNQALLSVTLLALSAVGFAAENDWRPAPEYDFTVENSKASYMINLNPKYISFENAKFKDGSTIPTLIFTYGITYTPPLADGQDASIYIEQHSCSSESGKSGFSKTRHYEKHYTSDKVSKWDFHAPKWEKDTSAMNTFAQKACRNWANRKK
ncbi:hypothetical protein L4G92_08805 [Neisseria sp. ZJ106]|uniref:Uncharacterized protein n=1 Tax=Neisseria lisongii TaxID=2912188 RepID=A0ABY7RH84_9NEIS|nr:hypothetical protein [Neisseria lisongii]MCF7522139.1 hypothetical protein [Neisseria lisongii]WCL70949.1 hypothetical protein PJU73_06185 [Neisseria lisongii]